MMTREIRHVLDDFAVSFWLKDALRDLMQRDALDATRDAELLARLMRERLEVLQGARTDEGSEREGSGREPACLIIRALQ